jgi:hypothetical protein
MEHASVAAFARFVLELLSAGAPLELVEGAGDAMRDELRHTQICFGLASAYAGAPIGPGPLDTTGALEPVSFEARLTTRVSGSVCRGDRGGAAAGRSRGACDRSRRLERARPHRRRRDAARGARLPFRSMGARNVARRPSRGHRRRAGRRGREGSFVRRSGGCQLRSSFVDRSRSSTRFGVAHRAHRGAGRDRRPVHASRGEQKHGSLRARSGDDDRHPEARQGAAVRRRADRVHGASAGRELTRSTRRPAPDAPTGPGAPSPPRTG